MNITKKRKEKIEEWVEIRDIYDYFGEDYTDRLVLIGKSKDGNIYKKVIR
jgi:hypothetical protein